MVVNIDGINPTQIIAGNGSVLTISGSGFGATKAGVYFKNANDAGATEIPAPETNLLSWTDTEIRVKVPGGSGSGVVRVRNASNEEATSSLLNITDNYITVTFEDQNPTTNIQGGKEVEYRPHHVASASINGETAGDFDDGAYLFKYHTNFKANNNAVSSFENGFNDIVCSSGIDFKISANTTAVKTPAQDKINSISFDAVPLGVLGSVSARLGGTYTYDATTQQWGLYWFYHELDYVFDENQTWDFDLDGGTTSLEFDFNAVVRHETGHAAGLGHIINNQKIMHYSLTRGPNNNIGSNTIYGPVISKINHDKAQSTPNAVTATDFSTCYSNSLNIEDLEYNTFTLFPNPSSDYFNLSSNEFIRDVKIYNTQGTLVLKRTSDSKKSQNMIVDVSPLSSGFYFVEIKTKQEKHLIKFLKK